MEKRSIVSRYILELTVFVCGAIVMTYEIIGSRIVAPFIGTSIYVWTSLIGVILAALSLGYWLGGRVADRRPDIKVLAFIIFVAGGLISLTTLIKDLALGAIAGAPTGLELRSLLASILLFAPASIALGFVLPFAVKIKMVSLDESGKTVGRLYALSTIGSIAGTFAAGFFLIPFVGSVRSLYILAATLFAVSLVLAPFAFTRASFAAITLFVFGIGLNELSWAYLRWSHELYDIDTEYNRVQVFRTTDPKTGRAMRALATDPFSTQSAIYLDGDDLALRYTRFYHLIRHFRPDFRHTLMIGGAGYTFPREYLRTYPAATIDVVEIDPGMTDIARQHFRLEDDPRLKIIHEDGRVYLNRSSAEYDGILIDAFGSLFSVPQHLTTVEAVRNLDRLLDGDGVVIFNLGSAIRGGSSSFLQAELATYRTVFPNVYLFKVNPDYDDERIQNVIVVACKSNCESNVVSDQEISRLLSHRYTDEIPLDRPILTDDLAPVEYYNSFGQDLYRR
jgi:spermidine synthase